MTHPDLFSLPQNWRNSDPATSEEAGLAAWEFLGEHHRKIMQVFSQHKRPLAAEQIGDLLGWEHYHPVGRRLHELIRLGLIEQTTERHTNRTGRSAFRYRPKT